MPGVYISFPFCAQKCTYCNFASGVLPRSLKRDYLAALHREIAAHSWAWKPETLYLGGGTPGQIEPLALHQLVSAIPRDRFVEATIEAAPGQIDAARVEAWVRSGINRVSLGVQSFDENELARTGRRHRASHVAADLDLLARHGITNVNVDLIAGLPGQTRETWRASLDWIERLAPPHVSVYMLEVDEDSRLGREILAGGLRYGAAAVPSEELVVELYETAVERLRDLGIPRYEISNFARPGFESRHNLKYWRMEPYAGFGADAHSFDGVTRRQNVEQAKDYVERSPQVCAAETEARLSEERLFTGLRLQAGIRVGPDEWRRFGDSIHRHVSTGLLEREGDLLRLTNRGVLFSNEVFSEFVTV